MGFQVVDVKERETGIEPATSSLGSWKSLGPPCELNYATTMFAVRMRLSSDFTFEIH